MIEVGHIKDKKTVSVEFKRCGVFMKISVRFTAAVHTLLCIDYFENERKVTSEFISKSTGVNAVIIRKILLQLQKAGLITTAIGSGGSRLAVPLKTVSLLDVFKAVNTDNEEREVFNFHPNPNEKCPVGSKIRKILDPCLEKAEKAMEIELSKTSLADLQKGLKKSP